MKLTIHPMAWAEYREAARYLKLRKHGLAESFLAEIKEGLQQILASPQTYPVIGGGVRRYLIRRFPYGILYRWEGDEISVFAIMHMRREPDYWKPRL
jgi:plasmid stabilization system protein ParE